jgi:hypothetical protein
MKSRSEAPIESFIERFLRAFKQLSNPSRFFFWMGRELHIIDFPFPKYQFFNFKD